MTHVPVKETNTTTSTRVTRADGAGQTPRRAPLRGVAMILIAVGILLAIWGVFRVLGNHDDTSPAPASSSTSQAVPPGGNNQGRSSQQTGGDGGDAHPASPKPDAAGQPDAARNPAGQYPGDQTNPAPAPADGADHPPAVDPKKVPVAVLNNSTITGLADQQATRLRGGGWTVGEVGNFPDASLPESVVYFTPGNAAEEATAKALGEQLHVRVAPRDPVVEHTPAGVVLIITKDIQ